MSHSVPRFFKKKFVVNSCSYIWETFIVRMQRHCPSMQGWSYKAKIHLELDLAATVKGCKKAFYCHISNRGKSRENTLNGAGDWVTKGMEKAEIINVSFALVCTDDI